MNVISAKVFCCLILWFILVPSTRMSAQTFSSGNSVRDELFMYEVKSVDEFIERFDDDPSSFIRKEFQKQNRQFLLTRAELLISLFNLDNNWVNDSVEIKGFIRQAIDKKRPQYIYFKDTGWYAEARCVFIYNEKLVEIPLILHIKNEINGAKWMINGIGNDIFFEGDNLVTEPVPVSKSSSNKKYISTTGHATNFVELHNVFSDSMEPYNYFDPQLLAAKKARLFVQLILQGKITFQYVKNIKYHFYQMPGWIFEVQQFERENINSGWLISSIKKVTKSEKEIYRRKLLHT